MSGQERRQWLDDLGRDLEYYVPPELRSRIGLLGKALEFTDAGDMIAAEEASRELWNNPSVGSAANYAAAGLGLALPVVSSRMMQEGVDVAGDAISSLADDARSIWSRLNQPGPVPTMNAIFPSGSSLDEVFGFLDKNKPIYHSGPADMAEEMQKWGVEPSYGPWVREIAAGAVDDVDEFLDQTPPAAWWSDQPDWIKMKVARAAKKPVSDVTVDDIRKHGHLAIASADDYSDVAFRIGDEGLDNGEYSFVEDLAGNRMRFYETPLYSEGNYPFGIERNEIVTGEAIEPAYSLTGDDLVNFMQRQGLLDNPVGRAADDAPKGILAYHGSPHDFDRFSMEKIGTGEGAQAYGHGLYFTETPDIGRGYRDNVFGAPPRDAFSTDEAYEIVSNQLQGFGATPNALYDATEDLRKSLAGAEASNKIWKDRQSRVDALKEAIAYLENKADTRLMVGDKSVSDIYDALASRADRLPIKSAQANYDKMAILEDLMNDGDILGVMQRKADYDPAALSWFEKEIAPKFKRSGALYEVNIKANPDDFLDWDKTGPEQSDSVRKALTSIANKDPQIMQAFKDAMQRGDKGAIYESLLQDKLGDLRLNQEAAAKRLREAGIPGIKYLDAMSRNAGEGSRNYVVFDENLIEIVKKYGIAGAALMLGMSQADLVQAMQAQQPQQPQGLLGELQ